MTETQESGELWWQDAVVYQLYPRSFADSNGDGIGDFEGIRSHLDHLRDLGVDAIWLTPVLPVAAGRSRLRRRRLLRHRADVRHARRLRPHAGRGQATRHPHHARHRAQPLQLRPRLVPGGAEGRARFSRERARFWFKDGKGPNGDEPPNNWRAIFGGPAWTRVTEADGTPGQWYEHTFTPGQPDFNWYNPDVIDYFDRMLTFWFDRGVEGIRVDAVPVLGKHPDMPDSPPAPPGLTDGAGVALQHPRPLPPVSAHDVWKHWRTLIDQYEIDHPGGISSPSASRTERQRKHCSFLQGDEFHQNFAFELMLITWQAKPMRDAIAGSLDMLESVGGAPGVDHEQPRHAAHRHPSRPAQRQRPCGVDRQQPRCTSMRPIDLELGRRRARAAITLAAALPGALYLYQGEEMGLEEYLDMPARGPRRSAVHPHRRQGARSRRLPRATAVDDRSGRHRSGSRRRPPPSHGCRSPRLGRALGRARSSRPAVDARLVPHAAGSPPAAVGRPEVGRLRSAGVLWRSNATVR